MGSDLNFNHFGGEPSAAAERGGHNNMSLTRQTSIYSLTFDELQNSMGGSLGGKDFGSMNMDELLKNIWTAEESQALAAATAAGLQRQGSLTLPRTLITHKTVDEIWKDMSSKDGGGASASGAGFPQKQPTLGEITLEEFLVRAGVVREDASTTQTTNGVGFYADLMMRNNNNTAAVLSSGYGGFGFPQDGLMTNNSNNNQMMMMQSSNLPLNVNGVRSSHQLSLAPSHPQPLFPKQPGMSYGNPLGAQLASRPRMRGGQVGIADTGLMQGGAGLRSMTGVGAAATITAASGSPAQLSSDGLGISSYGDLSSLSPVPYMFNGGVRGRKPNGAVEKVVERRQRRMIKNRESAARSRARKQAYTMELEAEVAKLKEENQELQKKQAEIMVMQKNQVLEMMNDNQGSDKRQRLRRTQTGLW